MLAELHCMDLHGKSTHTSLQWTAYSIRIRSDMWGRESSVEHRGNYPQPIVVLAVIG